mmetsp:Transcript_2288/g.4426  ORF Transcript_2288/g.4426 Transcript_2288/m.4426 type:complete len:228 (-) Transcript_2288:334-1017(-)
MRETIIPGYQLTLSSFTSTWATKHEQHIRFYLGRGRLNIFNVATLLTRLAFFFVLSLCKSPSPTPVRWMRFINTVQCKVNYVLCIFRTIRQIPKPITSCRVVIFKDDSIGGITMSPNMRTSLDPHRPVLFFSRLLFHSVDQKWPTVSTPCVPGSMTANKNISTMFQRLHFFYQIFNPPIYNPLSDLHRTLNPILYAQTLWKYQHISLLVLLRDWDRSYRERNLLSRT